MVVFSRFVVWAWFLVGWLEGDGGFGWEVVFWGESDGVVRIACEFFGMSVLLSSDQELGGVMMRRGEVDCCVIDSSSIKMAHATRQQTLTTMTSRGPWSLSRIAYE